MGDGSWGGTSNTKTPYAGSSPLMSGITSGVGAGTAAMGIMGGLSSTSGYGGTGAGRMIRGSTGMLGGGV